MNGLLRQNSLQKTPYLPAGPGLAKRITRGSNGRITYCWNHTSLPQLAKSGTRNLTSVTTAIPTEEDLSNKKVIQISKSARIQALPGPPPPRWARLLALQSTRRAPLAEPQALSGLSQRLGRDAAILHGRLLLVDLLGPRHSFIFAARRSGKRGPARNEVHRGISPQNSSRHTKR